MSEKNFLVFDFGATSGRALLAGYDGGRVRCREVHRFDNRSVLLGETLYWDLLNLYAELKRGIQMAAAECGRIDALGLDAWGADLVFLDRRGSMIANPVSYRDQRKARDAGALYRVLPEREIFQRTGYRPNAPIFDLHHLFSLKRAEATELACGTQALGIADALAYFLTGTACREYSRLAMSLIFDQAHGRLDTDILQRIGVPPELFPAGCPPGEVIGRLRGPVAEELRVNPIPVVSVITHDTPSAAAGVPALGADQFWAFLTMGTWFTVGRQCRAPILSDDVFDSGFSFEAMTPDMGILVKNITGLFILEECRRTWRRGEAAPCSWPELIEAASRASAFDTALDVHIPELCQVRDDMPDAIRRACARTNQPVPGNVGELARCVFLGLAKKVGQVSARLGQLHGRPVERLYLLGGGTRNPLLCQMIADATGLPCVVRSTETSSMGNLLMQLLAVGEIADLQQGREVIDRSFETVVYEPTG